MFGLSYFACKPINSSEEVSVMRTFIACIALMFCVLLCCQVSAARNELGNAPLMPAPNTQIKSHTLGNMKLVISNWGFLGNEADYNEYEWSCEFPADSNQDYLFQGALWIGGIVAGETLVSVGADGWLLEHELFPGSAVGDTILQRSCDTLSPYYHPDAISEQDLLATYTDTITDTLIVPPGHRPIGIKITQQTYCWRHDHIKDSILMRLLIENIRGDLQTVRDIYVGLYIDGDVTPVTSNLACRVLAAGDDITGFRAWGDESDTLWTPGTTLYHWNDQTQSYDSTDVGGTPKYQSPCHYTTAAWLADDDGIHPDPPCTGAGTADAVTGARVVCPAGQGLSYNWWFSDPDDARDWGPHHSEDPDDVAGTPMGDNAKYRIMMNGYFDPDQVCDSLVYPAEVDSINDTRYLLSFGPHDLPSGDTLEIALAFIGGEQFHNNGTWCEWNFDDFATNASWAHAVCDNPGIDTDGDGYAGDFVIVAGETLFICGDGIPDFRVPRRWPSDPCLVPTGIAEGVSRPGRQRSELRQNLPNPFSVSTRIIFALSDGGALKLDVFDISGRLVANLLDTKVAAGYHECRWNGLDGKGQEVPSGVYFYRLSSEGQSVTRKMVVVR